MNPFAAFQLNPPPVKAPTRKAGPSLADQPLGLELPRRQLPTAPLAAGRSTADLAVLPLGAVQPATVERLI